MKTNRNSASSPATNCASPIRIVLMLFLAGLCSGIARAQITLTNGAYTTNTLVAGTTNSYTFSATSGDSIVLRMGTAASFNPRIDLYNPSGTPAGSASAGGAERDAELFVQATNTGIFMVKVRSQSGGGNGAYLLNLAHSPETFVVSPGDQGGPMTNGYQHSGTIAVGDLDLWSFSANAGDSIVLRMGATNFNPQIRLFGPDGKLVASDFAGGAERDAEVPPTTMTNSGTFTVVVNSYYPNGTGAYILTLAKSPGAFVVSPGDQGGPMTNGYQHSGTIAVGDLDLWSFSANAGDSIVLRMGATNFNPQIRLFGPDGKLVAADLASGSQRDAEVPPTTMTNSGTFTVVVNSGNANGTGAYILTLAKSPGTFVVSPGDQGGPMTNGYQHSGTITVGDLDLWSFSANAGDSIVLRMGATNFNPQIRLFDPDGKLVESAEDGKAGNRDVELSVKATNSGAFTVVVNSYYPNGTGAYILTLAKSPGAFVVSPGDEGGLLTGGVSRDGVIDVGDIDMWRFAACRGQLITLRCQKLSGTNFSPRIRLYGRNGALLATNVNASLAVINFAATNTGIYTALVEGGSANDSGTYRLSGNGLSDDLNLCIPKVSGTNLNLGGVGGTPNATFVLLTHTNVTASVALWTPILTNQFDSFGVFDYTTLFNPAEPQRFFLLREQ